MAPAPCATRTTLCMSFFTASVSPERSAPTLITMSISCAPERSAAAVSHTLASVLLAPSGNPTTLHTLTGEPASSAFTSGTQ